MPRPSGTHHADPLRLRRGLTGRALVVASLLVALAAGTGCSAAKPARKKGKSKAAAAREREERPLLEATDAGAAKAETADDGGGVPAPDGAAATTEPATATDPVGPTDDATSPSAEPAPPAAPPQPITTDDASASLPPLEAPAPGGPRPRSPLVDPDTAIPLDGGRVEVSSPVEIGRAHV